MSQEEAVQELTAQVMALATEIKNKPDIPADRIAAIEAEIEAKSAKIDELLAAKAAKDIGDRISGLEDRLKAFSPSTSAKASAILAGAGEADDEDDGHFMKALFDAAHGDVSANAKIKAVLGTSGATGQYILPNNFVSGIVEIASAGNVYRQIMNVVTGVRGKAIDIPYEITGHAAALLQGAYGSNKDIRDFSLGSATATLYTIAEIVDLGNQLIRQSEGAAEQLARRRLGKAFARAEATYITAGTGSSQPEGIFTAFGVYGGTAFNTALSSEPRAAAIGRGISALETRSYGADGLAVVMNPTDYWEMAVEGLGTAYAGGWAMDPTGGPSGTPRQTVWGVPVYRDPFWPTAQAGTALVGAFGDCDLFFGAEYRVDISSEGGSRFDNNTTGFRGEEEMGFNADPYVLTGKFQKVTGV